jgi:hypothetical protein
MKIVDYLKLHENDLMHRILYYAKRQNYTKYTSTLIEAWKASIVGLTDSISAAYEDDLDLNFVVDEVPDNRVTDFGKKEAMLHRNRGVTLEMFLCLSKYYRDSYIDIINDSQDEVLMAEIPYIIKVFDQIEVSYIYYWNLDTLDLQLKDLKDSTRKAVNEKNLYLTIFESLSVPMLIFDENFKLKNLNLSAQEFFTDINIPRNFYYVEDKDSSSLSKVDFINLFNFEIEKYYENNYSEIEYKINIDNRDYTINVSSILDVSGKTQGFLVSLISLGY